ncbi:MULTISPECIES: hypothetical protein [Paenibacillus]|nr:MULTISPECIES: hypothetical protein [Paenibacillus]MDH6430258.1 hypothetical protein [Paenibacillus sp. PastH-4]MDH6446473.1 hypothetical protein [Paenibacillus sp. PastF-4]MDH6530061.1 hypothetical protein [Paenibacillus sp. PastH-3]
MKTVIRFRDDQGRIIGSARHEKQQDAIDVLRDFSLALLLLGLVLLWI